MAKQGLATALSEKRKGFIRRRLGTDHVLDLEVLASALASKGAGWPAMVFLDMEVAFSSLSHRYLVRVVRKFPGAHPIADMIADMYRGASTQLLANGEVHEGLPIHAGVRQGCPASGSLFALAFHGLLVELATIDVDPGRVAFRCGVFAYAPQMQRSQSRISGFWFRRAGPIQDAFAGEDLAGAACACRQPGGSSASCGLRGGGAAVVPSGRHLGAMIRPHARGKIG